MMSTSVFQSRCLLAVLLIFLLFSHAGAQTYPAKPVRLVVPYSPGGGTDIFARAHAISLGAQLGQTVIVENKPGAATDIGVGDIIRGPSDGYNIVISGSSIVVAPHIRTMPFDPFRDLMPVALLARSYLFLASTVSFPARNLAEVVAHVKANPDAMNYGIVGIGITDHLAGELLKYRAGIKMVPVVYKGGAPALLDLLAGRIQLRFDALSTLRPPYEAGKLRLYAIASGKRSIYAPDIPTIAELGYPGFDVGGWYGFFVRAGTPPEIVARLASGVEAGMRDNADLKERYRFLGLEPEYGDSGQLTALMKKEYETYGKLIRETGIKIEN